MFNSMPFATNHIRGADPQQCIHGSDEESDEEVVTVGTRKDIRRGKIQWEKYEGILYKLYVEEDKPLPVVMEVMKGNGLDAT